MRLRITRQGLAELVIGLFAQGRQPGGAYEGFEPPKVEDPDHRSDVGVVVTDHRRLTRDEPGEWIEAVD